MGAVQPAVISETPQNICQRDAAAKIVQNGDILRRTAAVFAIINRLSRGDLGRFLGIGEA